MGIITMKLTASLPAAVALSAAFALAACGGGNTPSDSGSSSSGDDEIVRINLDPYPSTYEPQPSGTTLIRGGTVLDGIGGQIENGDVLIENGRIAAIGTGLEAPEGATVIDAAGRYVTPGVIDIHSHLGVYPSPGVHAHSLSLIHI